MQLDWVKRKAIGEQFMENQTEDIWRDLCTALASAVESYNLYYGGAARTEQVSSHHFCITVHSKAPYQDAVIDVHFVPPEVRVTCRMGPCKKSTYILNPNKEAPFRDHEKRPLSIDQLSEAILHCTFFPMERRGVPAHTVSPCTGV